MRTLQSARMHDLPSPFDVFSAAPERPFTIEHANGARTFVNNVAKDFHLTGADYKERWSELYDVAIDQYILRANLPVTDTVRALLMRAVDEYVAERGR